MAYQQRERTCIYCQMKADSLEHVIPKWIPKHFGLSGDVMTHDRAIGIGRIGGARFGDFAARIYCAAHHKHLNRTIENRPTRELIKRLLRGTADTLDYSDQARLAAWATKTCYAQWGMLRRRYGIPIAHRRHLIEYGEPHPSVFVSASRCTGDRIRILFARTEITSATAGTVSHHYNFVLALGRLALKVWGPTSRARSVAYKEPTSFAIRVWPVIDDVTRWPAGRVLDDNGVTELWDYDPRAGKTSRR
jgi:hypothetical protein